MPEHIFGFRARSDAERAATALSARRLGEYALGMPGEPASTARKVVGYIVDNYARGLYGVVERWQYIDRPDLGDFGGAFMERATIDRLLKS